MGRERARERGGDYYLVNTVGYLRDYSGTDEIMIRWSDLWIFLVIEVPPDTEFELRRVDRVGVGREVVPVADVLADVLIFYEQVGSFYIQRDEHVEFRVVSGFLDLLVVELHDCRVVSVGVE